jgi:L1 cell adhesion molecule like protein
MVTPPIGIDLGTTMSCVGVWWEDEVHIVPNEDGEKTTPSVIQFGVKERQIGKRAKNKAGMNPTNTIYAVKRLIGQQMKDEKIKADQAHMPF